jgi:hypothetical protein
MRLAWNRLTENSWSGTLTITKMIPATNRMAVSSALWRDGAMSEADGAKAGPEAGEMERQADAVGTIKRHEK